MKVFGIEKVMMTRQEHDAKIQHRHEDNLDRFDRLENKQDEIMKLLIDMLRKQ